MSDSASHAHQSAFTDLGRALRQHGPDQPGSLLGSGVIIWVQPCLDEEVRDRSDARRTGPRDRDQDQTQILELFLRLLQLYEPLDGDDGSLGASVPPEHDGFDRLGGSDPAEQLAQAPAHLVDASRRRRSPRGQF